MATIGTGLHAEPLDEVIGALKIRDYLLASEAQCRQTARAQARRQVGASVAVALAGRKPSAETQSRLEQLSETYAREACRIGIDEGIMQRYRSAYAAALTAAELEAALAFLSSPEGRRFAAAGLAANREVLPLISRRQESQASRAAVLLRGRLAPLLSEIGKETSGAVPGAQ